MTSLLVTHVPLALVAIANPASLSISMPLMPQPLMTMMRLLLRRLRGIRGNPCPSSRTHRRAVRSPIIIASRCARVGLHGLHLVLHEYCQHRLASRLHLRDAQSGCLVRGNRGIAARLRRQSCHLNGNAVSSFRCRHVVLFIEDHSARTSLIVASYVTSLHLLASIFRVLLFFFFLIIIETRFCFSLYKFLWLVSNLI